MRIGTGRYSQLLGRFLAGTAELEIAADLSPEISPVFVLENDRPEWEFLKNGKLMAAAGGLAASVGSPSVFRFRNPLNSNVIAVIEHIWISCLLAATARIEQATGDTDRAVVLAAQGNRDSRQGTMTTGAIIISSDNSAPGGNPICDQHMLAATSFRYDAQIVVGPRGIVDFGTTTLNADLKVAIAWREREIGRYEKR